DCGTGGAGGEGGAPAGPLVVSMDFTRAGGFYASPFPSDDRLAADGSVDVTGFPNGTDTELPKMVVDMITKDARGFGTTSGVFFHIEASLGAVDGLPDRDTSTKDDASVFLVDVDASSPEVGTKKPVDVAFLEDGGPFGDANLLSLLPFQGIPLRPKTRYAAVVTTKLASVSGKPVGADATMQALAAKKSVPGLASDVVSEYEDALDALDAHGTARATVAGLAVFTTGDPTAEFEAAREVLVSAPLPMPDPTWTADEQFTRYCVFESTIEMPDFQSGTSPYTNDGGNWVFDASGAPVVQHMEQARIFVTVPQQAMPAAGFPIVLFSRTGAGGDRPLVDRGVQATNGGPPIVPGSGPADYFAMAGFAGASVDGPLGGIRLPPGDSPADEDYLIFNVGNPRALRDNVRQSAVELALQAHVLGQLSFDASSCPGFSSTDGDVKFDSSKIVIMGHSMGATISPLALSTEPLFRAAILSGAGGSWIENVVYKQSPLPVLPLIETLVGTVGSTYTLGEHDPLLSLFQWGAESADPPVYTAGAVRAPTNGAAPRDVLMEQGIVDTYILPPIADAMSLSIGLDLGGEELDQSAPALAQFTPLGDLLGLVGRQKIAMPVAGNLTIGGVSVTAMVAQHPQDDVEDGHEIIFQTDPPKREYVCLLMGLAAGTGAPTIPQGSAGAVGTCD
ncbi:MAG TPA: hypothetical protein VGM56_27970, partial [Byssovorax sp.]